MFSSCREIASLQSTPPRRGRLQCVVSICLQKSFNPRPRAGGDSPVSATLSLKVMLQSTPPRRGRPAWTVDAAASILVMLQSTPPRRGRLGIKAVAGQLGASIHAPAQGATVQGHVNGQGQQLQSTPPRRGRPSGWGHAPGPQSASIHAPAQGATWSRRSRGVASPASIHAPAQGATARPRGHVARGQASIHAPAQGATIATVVSADVLPSFNPRPRAGGDRAILTGTVQLAASIHAPAQGATPPTSDICSQIRASIHAPAQGATARCVDGDSIDRASIHAPAQGATKSMPAFPSRALLQSTPPRRGRLFCFSYWRRYRCFNPRPRAGGDLHGDIRRVPLAGFNPRPRAGGDDA